MCRNYGCALVTRDDLYRLCIPTTPKKKSKGLINADVEGNFYISLIMWCRGAGSLYWYVVYKWFCMNVSTCFYYWVKCGSRELLLWYVEILCKLSKMASSCGLVNTQCHYNYCECTKADLDVLQKRAMYSSNANVMSTIPNVLMPKICF